MRARWFVLSTWSLAILAACGDPEVEMDAGRAQDAGTDATDAARTDASRRDGGTDAAPIDAGPIEICTPSTGGAVPADEDGDLSIDEGCPWHFGPTSEIRYSNGPPSFYNLAPKSVTIAAGGRRVYYTVGDWNGSYDEYTVRTATRDSRADALVPGPDVSFADGSTPRFSISDDELVALAVSESDVMQYRRSSASEAFGEPTVVGTYENLGDLFMMRDGLEIWFGVYLDVARARRASVDESFGPAEIVEIAGYGGLAQHPALSPDGRTIFFGDYATQQLHMAVRADRETLVFDAPVPIDFVATGAPHNLRSCSAYSEETQELFTIAGQVSTNTFNVLLRTRVCRDGPCPAFEIPCTGTRTRDGARCFTRYDDASDWPAAESSCAALGGHLASGHTYEEAQIIAALAGDTLTWIGLSDRATEGRFEWATGEWSHLIPLYFLYWDEIQPDNDTSLLAEGEDCVCAGVDRDGDGLEVWGDDECNAAHPRICETEVWPTW